MRRGVDFLGLSFMELDEHLIFLVVLITDDWLAVAESNDLLLFNSLLSLLSKALSIPNDGILVSFEEESFLGDIGLNSDSNFTVGLELMSKPASVSNAAAAVESPWDKR